MSLDHPTPTLERKAVSRLGRGPRHRLEQEPALGLEMIRSPSNIAYIEGWTTACAELEPLDQLVLPAGLGERPGLVRRCSQHLHRDVVRDDHLGARTEALIGEHHHLLGP